MAEGNKSASKKMGDERERSSGPAISMIDCHVHFLDASRFRYPIFPERSAGFEALVGDYGALPRRYLPVDYLADTAGLQVDGTVWAEFMSSTPLEELRWAQSLADAGGQPTGMIVCVDFRAPDFEHTLLVRISQAFAKSIASLTLH